MRDSLFAQIPNLVSKPPPSLAVWFLCATENGAGLGTRLTNLPFSLRGYPIFSDSSSFVDVVTSLRFLPPNKHKFCRDSSLSHPHIFQGLLPFVINSQIPPTPLRKNFTCYGPMCPSCKRASLYTAFPVYGTGKMPVANFAMPWQQVVLMTTD